MKMYAKGTTCELNYYDSVQILTLFTFTYASEEINAISLTERNSRQLLPDIVYYHLSVVTSFEQCSPFSLIVSCRV